MEKDLLRYIVIVLLLYIVGAVVDAMVEVHTTNPQNRLYLNLYQFSYLTILMVIVIPLLVYFTSKIAIKIGPKKPVILLIMLLPFASAFWDMTFGALVYKNPFWIGKSMQNWFTMPIPSGELTITIPAEFSTAWVIIRIVLGICLLWVFFKKILPSKKFIINLE